MAYTFNFTPSKSFQKASKTRVLSAQFGDGYSQRIGDGINRITNTWTLSFTARSTEQADSIIEFLEARGGISAFNWTPPGESKTYAVICNDWTKVYDSHLSATVQATFIQVFDILV